MKAPDKLTLARANPAGFAWYCSGESWIPAEHLILLSEKLTQVACGELPRLMVFMPPRHGKSELISRYTPAWFLGRFPGKKVMLCSYSDTFAATWGRQARDILKTYGPAVFGVGVNPETAGGQQWEVLGDRGVMVTAGVGGGITGKGADLLIIDDPVKNAEDASSELVQQRHIEWWKSTARTRLQKGAGVVLVMTRWHEADLAGQLIGLEVDEDGDRWEVLSLPARAEEETTASFTLSRSKQLGADALNRNVGDVLWPEMFDSDWMDATRRALGPYWWNALYRQQPSSAEGNFFKRADFRYFERHAVNPEGSQLFTLHRDSGPDTIDAHFCTKIQTIDAAESEKKQSDYTVIATWLITPAADLVLWDRVRVKFDSAHLKPIVRAAFFEQQPKAICIEKRSAGTHLLAELAMEGLPVLPLQPDTDKVTRALPASARMSEHRVFFPLNEPWVAQELEPELLNFPNASNDDQVDVLAYAAAELPMFAGTAAAGHALQLRVGNRTQLGGVMTRRF